MNEIKLRTSILTLKKIGTLTLLVLGFCVNANGQNQPPSANDKLANKKAESCDKNCKEIPANVDFSPPPVPSFMLERTGKTLSLEEMVQQAKEAVLRSQKAADANAPKTPQGKSLD